jgi:putative intracellular protease/amidase
VDVTSVSGQNDVSGRSQKIENLLRLSEVKLDDYVGVIIPCMGAEDVTSPKMVTTVKDVLAKGKPIAASYGAVAVLAKAGVLKGRKFAFMLNPSDPLFKDYFDMTDFEGATYSGPGVVQDGKIITGGTCPISEAYRGIQNRTFELTQTFIAAIKPK